MPGVLGSSAARIAGLATGLALVAVVALLQWSVAPSAAPLGLDIKLTAEQRGELEVGPAGPAILGRGVRPGHEAAGTVRVRNQTVATLAVRPRLLEGTTAVDEALRLELTAGGRPVFSGTAGELRRGESAFRLASGERTALAIRASVPEGAEDVTRGRAGEWRLTFDVEVIR